jgi:aspartate aminotransferase-like enzyme
VALQILEGGPRGHLGAHRSSHATRGRRRDRARLPRRAPSPRARPVVPGHRRPALRTYLRELGYTVADGQGKLKGKIFRIAHLGYFDRFDTIGIVAAVEMALAALGRVSKLGEGARTATELLRD